MDEVIIRVLTAEVRRRRCPGCGHPLREADVSAGFAGVDKVRLRFRCQACVFEGGGEIELTPEIYREPAQIGPAAEPCCADPISADELISVHEILSTWNSGMADLLVPVS
ncbi:MAG: hypothetical protein ACREPA_09055 [Candidatus Dormibacteraceae bacterium]